MLAVVSLIQIHWSFPFRLNCGVNFFPAIVANRFQARVAHHRGLFPTFCAPLSGIFACHRAWYRPMISRASGVRGSVKKQTANQEKVCKLSPVFLGSTYFDKLRFLPTVNSTDGLGVEFSEFWLKKPGDETADPDRKMLELGEDRPVPEALFRNCSGVEGPLLRLLELLLVERLVNWRHWRLTGTSSFCNPPLNRCLIISSSQSFRPYLNESVMELKNVLNTVLVNYKYVLARINVPNRTCTVSFSPQSGWTAL